MPSQTAAEQPEPRDNSSHRAIALAVDAPVGPRRYATPMMYVVIGGRGVSRDDTHETRELLET